MAVSDASLTWGAIGDLIGRTGHACRVEAAKYGWVPRKFGPGRTARANNLVPSGKPWTREEEAALAAEWASTAVDLYDIAAKHSRTPQAIRNRACKLNLGRKAIREAPPAPAQLSADYGAELLRRGISQETINMMGKK